MWLTDEPCDLVGPSKEMCENGGGKGGSGGGASDPGSSVGDSLDPLSNLAHSCAKAAAWVARHVGDFLEHPTGVFDVTNGEFLRQYAVLFAASTFLVLLLWLIAVAKRAIRGVPFTTAIMEAVGLLWLTVLTTAFMPLVLYTVVAATSAVSQVIGSALSQRPGTVFDALADALTSGDLGGGPIMLIVTSLLVMLLCGAVGVLMVLRTLALYVGALLGIPVASGIVDRDLWIHMRRWSGFMGAVIGIEPVVVIAVGLSGAVQAEDDIVKGIGIMAVACAAAIALITKMPGWGDSVRVARMVGKGLGGAVNTVVGGGSATSGVLQGIHAHGGRQAEHRPPPQRSTGGSSNSKSAGGISGGIGAHSQRSDRKGGPDSKKKDS